MKSEVNNDLLDNIRMEIILTDLTDSCMSICLSELEYTMWPSRFGGTNTSSVSVRQGKRKERSSN